MSKLDKEHLYLNKVKLYVLIDRCCTEVLRGILTSAGYTEDLSNADITKMCKVLRKKFEKKPSNFDGNWGKAPRPTDRSEGADVFRIRLRRNEVYHKTDGMDDETFNEIWKSWKGSV